MKRHNLGAVIRFEFTRTVLKPKFWLISLSVPLLIAVVVGLVTISSQATANRADSQDRQTVSFTYTDASGLVDAAVAAAAGGSPVTDAAAARAAVVAGTSQCHVDYPEDPLSQPIAVQGQDLGLFDSGRYSAVASSVFSQSVAARIGDPKLAALAVNEPDVELVTYAAGTRTAGFAGVIVPGLFLVLFYMAVLMLGNQMLNVTLGGDLIQHLPDEVGDERYQLGAAQFNEIEVSVEPGTKIAEVYGDELSATAPLYHHQAIGEVAPGLVVTSRTEDGVIEAVELPDSTFCLAVQWHPEEHEKDRRLFAGLVEAARARIAAAGVDRDAARNVKEHA